MIINPVVVSTAATTVGSVLMLNVVGIVAAHYPRHSSGLAQSG